MVINWQKTAWVFPGQASQMVGMGKDFHEAYPAAREVFEQADEVLGLPLTALCFEGPEDELNDTINTQPALFTCGLAIVRALQTEVPAVIPGFVGGHSLGEFTALAAVGALSFEDGLRLVRERGRLMKEAGERSPGAMAAILALDAEQVRAICSQAAAQTGGVLILANDNCPGQYVISGDHPTLEAGMRLLAEAGARKVVKLAVSIAAHSPLMESASATFREVLAQTPFAAPSAVVIGNVDATALQDERAIQHELDRQLTNSVRWTESVQQMIASGAEVFLELGPKDVLTSLLKRIDRTRTGTAINSVENLKRFLGH